MNETNVTNDGSRRSGGDAMDEEGNGAKGDRGKMM